MSTVITPFQGTDPFSTATFNNRISQINTGFSYISNPNLLDNWYFGDPVDQRGWYVVPPDTPYYANDTGALVGTTDKYYTVTSKVSDKAYFSKDGAVYNVPISAAIRGYAKTFSGGQMYTIDRWMLTCADASGNVNVLIGDNYIEYNGVGNANFSSIIEGEFAGKTVTLTMIVEDAINCMFGVRNVQNWEFFNGTPITDGSGLVTITAAIPSDYSYDMIRVTISAGSSGESVPHSIKVKAAKLELGTTQTLAHQDENGNWVLNEILRYEDTLARCQRYAVKLNGKYWMPSNADGVLRLNIPLPVTMRAKPSVTFSQESQNTGTVVFDDNLSDENQIQFYMTNNGGWVNVNNIFATSDL